MNSNATKVKVRKVLSIGLATNVPVEGDFKRIECPQWDSLKHVEIIFLLEDEFGIQFHEDELIALNSVNNIVEILEKHFAS